MNLAPAGVEADVRGETRTAASPSRRHLRPRCPPDGNGSLSCPPSSGARACSGLRQGAPTRAHRRDATHGLAARPGNGPSLHCQTGQRVFADAIVFGPLMKPARRITSAKAAIVPAIQPTQGNRRASLGLGVRPRRLGHGTRAGDGGVQRHQAEHHPEDVVHVDLTGDARIEEIEGVQVLKQEHGPRQPEHRQHGQALPALEVDHQPDRRADEPQHADAVDQPEDGPGQSPRGRHGRRIPATRPTPSAWPRAGCGRAGARAGGCRARRGCRRRTRAGCSPLRAAPGTRGRPCRSNRGSRRRSRTTPP